MRQRFTSPATIVRFCGRRLVGRFSQVGSLLFLRMPDLIGAATAQRHRVPDDACRATLFRVPQCTPLSFQTAGRWAIPPRLPKPNFVRASRWSLATSGSSADATSGRMRPDRELWSRLSSRLRQLFLTQRLSFSSGPVEASSACDKRLAERDRIRIVRSFQ